MNISVKEARQFKTVTLTDCMVTLDEFIAVVKFGAKLEFSQQMIDAVNANHALLDKFLEEGRIIYGVTTGFGENVRYTISPKDATTLQENIVRTHSCAVGEPLDREQARAVMLMTILNAGKGHSGIRIGTLDLIRKMLNLDLIPFAPSEGSVGYLGVEAHLVMAYMGEGKIFQDGKAVPALPVLKENGLEPLVLSYKEGLSMLNGTITVTAQDRPVPAPSGSVRYEVAVAKADHGAVSASAARAAAGDTVTLTVQPDSGYVLAALTVTDSQGREVKLTRLDGGKYSFTMPGSRVEVQAAFAGIAFSDVPGGAYYEEAVRWAVEKGVTTGTTATTFSPSAPCTRAQLAAFLWRLAGEPESTRDLTFTDVRADAWCAKALRWAAEQGVVTGYADGSFRPDQTVTRIQAVAMLYRYARAQGMDTTQGGMAVREFDDFAAVPAYALEAAGWAVNAGILRGAGNRLMPNDPCTRAQIVTFLYRAMQGK